MLGKEGKMLPFTIKSTMTRDLYLRFSWKIFRQHKFAMAYLIIMPILILIYCVAYGLPIYGIFLASLFLSCSEVLSGIRRLSVEIPLDAVHPHTRHLVSVAFYSQ